MGTGSTLRLYLGYDNDPKLTLNGCIFRAAQHLRLVSPNETGFGWSKEEICQLSDQIRAKVKDDPTALNDLRKEIRVKLSAGLQPHTARLRDTADQVYRPDW